MTGARSSWFRGSGSARGRGTTWRRRCAPTGTMWRRSRCPDWSPPTRTVRRSRWPTTSRRSVTPCVRPGARRAGRAQRRRRRRLRGERPRPGADRGDGVRRLRPGDRRARPRAHGGRAPASLSRTSSPPRRTSTGSRMRSSRPSGAARCPSRARSFATHRRSRTTRAWTCRTTVLCTGFSSEQVKEAVSEGYAWLGGFAELRNVTWVDMPTSHWPMWSRPRELAGVLSDVARAAVSGPRDA